VTYFTYRCNCGIKAWSKLVSGEADWFCLRHTKYSRLTKYVDTWWWTLFIMPIGIALQWICMIGLLFGWVLRWGAWYHAAWVLPGGEWWEYQPLDDKTHRIVPPIIFKGVDQRIPEKRERRETDRRKGRESE